jgi:hypothetical protein
MTTARADRPLGPMERLTWLWSEAIPLPMGICVRIASRGRALDPDVLRRALDETQARHPLLRVRVEGRLRPRFVSAGVPAIPLELSTRPDPESWLDAVDEESARVDWGPGPLVRARLLSGSDAAELVVVMHHIVGDGLSLLYLTREIVERVAAILEGRPRVFPPVQVRPSIERALRGRRPLAPVAAMTARFAVAAARRPFVIPAGPGTPRGARSQKLLTPQLDPAEMTALADVSRAQGTTVLGALAAASMQAMIAAFGDAPENRGAGVMTCYAPVSLRASVDPPADDEVGLFAVPVLTTYAIPALDDFWGVARAFKRDVAACVARGEPGALISALAATLPPPVLAGAQRWAAAQLLPVLTVSNLGRVSMPKLPGVIETEVLGLFVGMNGPSGGGLAIAAATFDGRPTLCFFPPEPLLSRARTAVLAADVVRRLQAAAGGAPPRA